MKRVDTTLPGVFVIEPSVFRDERGFFFESYHEMKFAEVCIRDRFVQDNHSKSIKGTLRGLHYQITRPQAKLCRVIQGEVLDVAVDIRRGSPSFGQHTALRLSAENMKQVYIPAGFAHGYLVLSETAEFLYKCSDFYFPEYGRGVIWDDPVIAIPWGTETPILSAKDCAHPMLSKITPGDLPGYE
ncbi:MAG TPA: dTDP-4-dehydrorhamnose 3,5-epimerase [Blastocatellia bacterium]|nr:dTDP-4-dehydrorhamnose 3,5-epimerase [Blastocatellia bacterium]